MSDDDPVPPEIERIPIGNAANAGALGGAIGAGAAGEGGGRRGLLAGS